MFSNASAADAPEVTADPAPPPRCLLLLAPSPCAAPAQPPFAASSLPCRPPATMRQELDEATESFLQQLQSSIDSGAGGGAAGAGGRGGSASSVCSGRLQSVTL